MTMTKSAAPASRPAAGEAAKERAPRRRKAPGEAGPGKVAWWVRLVVIAAVLALWQLLASSPLVERDSLPTPVAVGAALVELWQGAEYWEALGRTLSVWAFGLGLCSLIGIPLGLLIGMSLRATQSTRWVIDFFRTIPTIALLPLVLLMFGTTVKMEVTMIVLSAVWPLLIQSMYSVKQTEPLLKWVARVFRLRPMDRIRFLWVPSVSLFVSTGMRLAAIMALLMTIAAEYIGGAPGLGAELSSMEQAFRRPEVFAYTVTAGVLGLVINMLVVQGQRRLLWWHPAIRGERTS